MRKIMEPGFYFLYLTLMVGVGLYLLVKSKKVNQNYIYLGVGCLLLAFGDAFHLIPRAIGLFTDTLDNPSMELAKWLGIGKLITSVTMTLFYVLVYVYFDRKGAFPSSQVNRVLVGLFAFVRLLLLAFPQNGWLTNGNDLTWGMIRNIPFVALGADIVVLTIIYLRKVKPYRFLFLAIILSFGFYIPVVVWTASYSWVGMLMLPKTICYLWIAGMFAFDAKKEMALS